MLDCKKGLPDPYFDDYLIFFFQFLLALNNYLKPNETSLNGWFCVSLK